MWREIEREKERERERAKCSQKLRYTTLSNILANDSTRYVSLVLYIHNLPGERLPSKGQEISVLRF